jgi:hypothetical protein
MMLSEEEMIGNNTLLRLLWLFTLHAETGAPSYARRIRAELDRIGDSFSEDCGGKALVLDLIDRWEKLTVTTH